MIHDGGGLEGVGVYSDVAAPALLLLKAVVIVKRVLPELRLAQAHVPEGRVNFATSPAKNYQTNVTYCVSDL